MPAMSKRVRTIAKFLRGNRVKDLATKIRTTGRDAWVPRQSPLTSLSGGEPIPGKVMTFRDRTQRTREVLRDYYDPIRNAFKQKGFYGAAALRTVAAASRMLNLVKTLPRPNRYIRNPAPLLMSGVGKVGGSLRKYPMRWTMSGIGVGLGVGVARGYLERYSATKIDRRTAPINMVGPGYLSWAKGAGREMPVNHLGTQGLTLALHKTRHR